MFQVHNEEELLTALASAQRGDAIVLEQSVTMTSSVRLPEGVTLSGAANRPLVLSFSHGDGVALAGDNAIQHLTVQTVPSARAIFLDGHAAELGTVELADVRTTGMVSLILRKPAKSLHVEAHHVDVVMADVRAYSEQQLKYGVTVEQGAFTVQNFSSDPKSHVTATLVDIRVGRAEAPAIGSGVYVAGFGDKGGTIDVERLETGEIHTNGMIPHGQANRITGGIFVMSGAHVKELHSVGSVTTYGVNDMVLDVWGEVDHWVTEKPIRSFSTSAIGFVNFGLVHEFEAKDVIETFGSGARAFNQYDGTIEKATFESLRTHGDGSIGMQVSRPVGRIHIRNDIETFGGEGESLVKGVIQTLKATALSVQPDGVIEELEIGGNLTTHGDEIVTLVVDEGRVESFTLGGEVQALGEGSQPKEVKNGGKLG